MLLLGVSTSLPLYAQLNTAQAVETGRSAMMYDDYETGIHYFTRAIEAKPYLAEAYYYRGFAHFNLGNFARAEEDISRAITFNPFHVEYFQLRGLCRIHNERYDGAVEDYTAVLNEIPADQNAHFNRALCHYALHNYTEAAQDLDYIIRLWPRFARAYVVKAQTCLEMQDTLQGLYWIDSLLSISKKEPIAWDLKGRQALAHQEYILADSCYTQALKYDAGNVNYYIYRAQARTVTGHIQEAINDYDRVLMIKPDEKTALHNIGVLKKSRDKKDPTLLSQVLPIKEEKTAISYLEEFKSKVENRSNERVFLPPFRVNGHRLYVEGGRYPRFTSDENFLDMINSADTEQSVSLSSAIFKLRKYAEQTPDDPIILYNLGCLEVEGGTIEDAEAAFSRAIEHDPLLAEAYYNKAVVHLLQNKTDLAKPLLVKAAEMGVVKAYRLLNQIHKM